MTAPRRPHRRSVLAGAAALVAPAIVRAAAPPTWRGRQFHNQPEDSHVHRFLVELWRGVARDTHGALQVEVFAQNAGVKGSDPEALRMVHDGRLEFFALMGGILGQVVPVAEIQGLPFAFANYRQIDRANTGALGALLDRECAAQGLHRFRLGTLENGFRQIVMTDKPIAGPSDLMGVRMRVPDGEMFRDVFATLGATPVTVNIADLYEALKTHRVDGQENPLAVTEVNRLYEVSRYVSMTNHMWSGFNLLGNGAFWARLPAPVQAIVERHAADAAARQRRYTRTLNDALVGGLARRGMVVNRVEAAPFRRALGTEIYRRWRERLGRPAWTLLEAVTGPLPA